MMRRDRRGEQGVDVWATLPTKGGAGAIAPPEPRDAGTPGAAALRPGLKPGALLSCLFVNCDSIKRQRAALVVRMHHAELIMANPASDDDYLRAADDYGDAYQAYARLTRQAERCC